MKLWLDNCYYPQFVSYAGERSEALPMIRDLFKTIEGDKVDQKYSEMFDKSSTYLDYKKSEFKNVKEEKDSEKEINLEKFSILDMSSPEVVQCLTRIDVNYLRNIPYKEFLYKDFENMRNDLPNSLYVQFADRLLYV